MRLEFKKLLESLGVNYELSPYETCPWLVYDEDKGITCSAEVRMNPDGLIMEAEIQFLHDNYQPSEEDLKKQKEEEEKEKSGEGGSASGESGGGPMANQPKRIVSEDGREQILWMRCWPISGEEWSVKMLRIQNKNFENEFHEWEEKGCDFFLSCVSALQMGELPDIDALIKDKMKDDSFFGGGRRGKIGRKSPNIKPESVLGMKK